MLDEKIANKIHLYLRLGKYFPRQGAVLLVRFSFSLSIFLVYFARKGIKRNDLHDFKSCKPPFFVQFKSLLMVAKFSSI